MTDKPERFIKVILELETVILDLKRVHSIKLATASPDDICIVRTSCDMFTFPGFMFYEFERKWVDYLSFEEEK